ncbi:MAG: maleylpyruvate isomerase N-terminal domain-containing protein, partial [Rhodococcus sp. (in: high G+C Gram-positive bacteria)]
MAAPTVNELVDAVEEVLTETVAFARTLTEADGDRPSDCPGWTVKDNLAHMVGLEQVLAGAPDPAIDLPNLAHVRSDIGRYMEGHVQIRRGLPLV